MGKVLLMYVKMQQISFLFHAAEEIENTLSYCEFCYVLLSLYTVDTVAFDSLILVLFFL
jgi:hypothetical protein